MIHLLDKFLGEGTDNEIPQSLVVKEKYRNSVTIFPTHNLRSAIEKLRNAIEEACCKEDRTRHVCGIPINKIYTDPGLSKKSWEVEFVPILIDEPLRRDEAIERICKLTMRPADHYEALCWLKNQSFPPDHIITFIDPAFTYIDGKNVKSFYDVSITASSVDEKTGKKELGLVSSIIHEDIRLATPYITLGVESVKQR